MKSEPEELIESMFRINSDIKFDNLKDESLDIDLSACAVIPLERSSGAVLLDLYLTNDESTDYGLTDLRAHSPAPEFIMPAIPQAPIAAAATSMAAPPQFKDVELSKKNKRKLSQPKRADSHVSDDDDSEGKPHTIHPLFGFRAINCRFLLFCSRIALRTTINGRNRSWRR